MAHEELVKRFQMFRQNYLDTPEGRQHYQNQLQEQREVQVIYQKLRSKQQQGEDVTDEVLKGLLPYADTKGNRERGNHISTWPCITKDVRSWFEGAKWKTPSEWPEVARWLLEIADAGQRKNWDKWEVLANQPVRKGFGCGFITPIVHCLNPVLPVINSKVVDTYKQIARELGINAEISLILSEYPQSQVVLLNLVKQLEPLGIKDLLEWDIYCHWNITKRLGGKTTTVSPSVSAVNDKQPKLSPSKEESVQVLCNELRDAQQDIENPIRFEKAIANAFHVLGFQAEHIGGSGETDVDAHALLGDESFSLVIDAKTCQPGRVRGDINYDALKGHQEQHAADYVLVAAQGFAQGNTVKFAENRGIGLLETRLLIQLVEETARSGISLYALKDIFGKSGLITFSLEAYLQPRNDMVRAMKAVLEIFETHQRSDESSSSLTSSSIFWMLKGQRSKFPMQYIEQAISLLVNPLVGVLEKIEDGYVLTLPANKASTRLKSLGEALLAVAPELLLG